MNAPLPPNAVAVATLPVGLIVPSPTNPRKHFDDAYLAELAESIKSHGVIQPITVRPNPLDTNGLWPYEIVVGECRWRAAQLAGIESIPGFWRDLDDKSVLEIQVIENLQRRDVSELEEADGYHMLMDRHGYTADQIAEKIGKSRAYVYARLKLTDLCHAGREAFYAGRLDASTALLIARIRGDKLQAKAIAECTKENWDDTPRSYRQNKTYLQHNFTISLKQATFKLGDATLLPNAGSCTDCPQRSGNDPAIFADIADADVCTDVKCFDEKKQARRDQLLALAEKKKLPVLQGNEFGWGSHSDPDEEDGEKIYVDLDECCDDDADERTYREILGDAAPVNAVAEVGFGDRKDLKEFATPTALAKALKKAGWVPVEEQPKVPPAEETAEQKAEREAFQARIAERAKEEERISALRDAEQARRTTLQGQIMPILQKLPDAAAAMPAILATLIIAMIERDLEAYDLPEDLLAKHGITLPDEFNGDEERARVVQAMREWPLNTLATFMLEWFGDDTLGWSWKEGESAPLLDPIAEILGLATPTQAAQAQGNSAETKAKGKAKGGKKAKAKAETAAATPPNEPAAPAETGGTHFPAWPFPTGVRS